jgi:hypothetical protein
MIAVADDHLGEGVCGAAPVGPKDHTRTNRTVKFVLLLLLLLLLFLNFCMRCYIIRNIGGSHHNSTRFIFFVVIMVDSFSDNNGFLLLYKQESRRTTTKKRIQNVKTSCSIIIGHGKSYSLILCLPRSFFFTIRYFFLNTRGKF